MPTDRSAHASAAPPLEVSWEGGTRRFEGPFDIGRADTCDVCLPDTARVSRCHVRVQTDGARWWAEDAGSANGLWTDGARTDRVDLAQETAIRLGEDGPEIRLRPAVPAPAETGVETPRRGVSTPVLEPSREPEEPHLPDPAHPPEPPRRDGSTVPAALEAFSDPPVPSASPILSDPPISLDAVAERYFSDEGGPAGERTRMIRQAYVAVREKERRQYHVLLLGALALCLAAVGVAGWVWWEKHLLEQEALDALARLRQQDLQITQRMALSDDVSLADLEAQTAARLSAARAYEGMVEELGVYRGLTEEEKLIYKVARIFNESEFAMPGGFVEEVKTYIDGWEQSSRFERAVQHAEQMGYTPLVVRAMRERGLPPEFFYLGLQESNFDTRAVGPSTRWGIAKGAWQFIPTTAEAYGLRPGPRAGERAFDPQDERHDFGKAVQASAAYLSDIYTQLAQASGLLAMASYNWGEHRVVPKMEDLPPPGFARARAAMAGLPSEPQERSYWRFLTTHRDRMPEETKGYVMHIFAAAVIGQNPRLFGIDLDPPLAKYLEAPLASLPSLPADSASAAPDAFAPVDSPFAEPDAPGPEPSRRLGMDALPDR